MTLVAQGRIKRLRSATLIEEKQAVVLELSICALCDREIPPALSDAHHLIPKSKGGVVTVLMHRACHKQIHALFTETELAKNIQALKHCGHILKLLDLSAGLNKSQMISTCKRDAAEIKDQFNIL